ncbi:MAG: transglycosylase SLT domain-containing protein [Nitrosomonas sp.]|nr:transglycosylase SLT domain-containing protein [Nitrosomonas sp.]MDP1950483.1 transglycosylase SLT domain-containing protein [Nitrosomonas sp.]
MMNINKIKLATIFLIISLIITFITFAAQATETKGHQTHAYSKPFIKTFSHSNDLWIRIRSGFALQTHSGKEVRENEASYTRDPDYLYSMTKQSERYLYHIVEEVERRGMPAEIALLPMVESAYDPEAESGSKAAGLWQFIPSTGESFGLTQNWWFDDRKDVIAATSAALDYLQNLYNKFEDWELALAAYNWGQGAVLRSIAKNREKGLPVNFHNIRLPDETRNHVHKLIAIKNIIANPAGYGIKLNTIPNKPYFDKVEADDHMDIELVAKLADISVDEFNALNPAYKQVVVKVDEPPRLLLLPANKVETFLTNLEENEEPLLSWQMHHVKKGEDVQKISQRHSISMAQLKKVNGITGNNKIVHGQRILVPLAEKDVGADITIVRKKPIRTRQPDNYLIYIIKKGDTLLDIARRHGTTVRQIRSWNRDGGHWGGRSETNTHEVFSNRPLSGQGSSLVKK